METFIAALHAPRQEEVAAVRAAILGIDASIQEGIKWNAPSFWRGAWFATFHLRSTGGLMLILHRGAKVRTGQRLPPVDDPQQILRWLADDRCAVTFADLADVRRKAAPLRAILRRWIADLDTPAAPAKP